MLAESSRCRFSFAFGLAMPSVPLQWTHTHNVHIHLQLVSLNKWKATASEHTEDILVIDSWNIWHCTWTRCLFHCNLENVLHCLSQWEVGGWCHPLDSHVWRAGLDPFFKTGDKTNPGSYRPVRLTSVVCKVFEGFMWDAINQHFAQNKLLVDQQYGFMSDGSCITQLLTTINDWMEILED